MAPILDSHNKIKWHFLTNISYFKFLVWDLDYFTIRIKDKFSKKKFDTWDFEIFILSKLANL